MNILNKVVTKIEVLLLNSVLVTVVNGIKLSNFRDEEELFESTITSAYSAQSDHLYRGKVIIKNENG